MMMPLAYWTFIVIALNYNDNIPNNYSFFIYQIAEYNRIIRAFPIFYHS